MLIDRARGYVFVHICKTAGTSVTQALLPFAGNALLRTLDRFQHAAGFQLFPPRPYRTHITARELVERLGQKMFDDLYSFAIVRNPWDWQVSIYEYLLRITTHEHHELIRSLGSFDAYIRWRCSTAPAKVRVRGSRTPAWLRTQRNYVYSKEGRLLIDHVARFEDLDAEFRRICARVGVPAKLPRLNVGSRSSYSSYYTRETERLVAATFEADIECFGYTF